MTPLVLAVPGNADLAAGLAGRLGAEAGRLTLRAFPDGESYASNMIDLGDLLAEGVRTMLAAHG